MNKKVLACTVVPALALALVGANAVSAHGFFGGNNQTPEEIAQHHAEMFSREAALLGTSEDVVKHAWSQGKRLPELAEELGISKEELHTKMQEARKAHMQERMQTLVDQGVITQEQANSRMEFMETMKEKRGEHAPDDKFRLHGPGKGGFMKGMIENQSERTDA